MSCDNPILIHDQHDAQEQDYENPPIPPYLAEPIVAPCGPFDLVMQAPDPDKPIARSTLLQAGQPIHEAMIDLNVVEAGPNFFKDALANNGIDIKTEWDAYQEAIMAFAVAGVRWRKAHEPPALEEPGSDVEFAPEPEPTTELCNQPIGVIRNSVDAFVREWCDGLKPGWGAMEYGFYLEKLYDFIDKPHDANMLSTTGLDCMLETVNQNLKRCGYPKQSWKTVTRKLTQLAKTRRDRESALVRRLNEEMPEQEGEEAPAQLMPGRFVALSARPTLPNVTLDLPRATGISDRQSDGDPITNFELVIEEDLTLEDDNETQRVFAGTIQLDETRSPFRISAQDFASNAKLQEAIFAAAGPRAEIRCKADLLRQAISAISTNIVCRRATTSFGWTKDRQAYLVPGGKITAEGFQAAGTDGHCRVDLGNCALGNSLDLQPLPADEVKQLKQHLVADWLPSHDRKVTYSLLGTVAASLLYPFINDAGRYTLWLSGLTGTGKSFQARMAQHFFGDFGGLTGKVQTWGSTPNHIQMTGYFFRHALYVVDDYKPSAITQSQLTHVLQVLQAYADNTARGRLRADASFHDQRPVRGFLVSTGEDIPEHSASTIARSILIDVPQQPKDVNRGQRCIARCSRYSAITADFVRWLLVKNQPQKFKRRFQKLRGWFYEGIAGQQNDLRIASNFALLAAGFWVVGKYLSDVWPNWRQEVKTFIGEDLIAVRDRMLGAVKEQQESEVFLDTLRELVEWGHVKITGHHRQEFARDHAPTVGKIQREGSVQAICLSVAMSLAEVQKSLRERGRPLLRATEQTLIGQLREDGHLLVETSRNRRLDGKQIRVVFLPLGALDSEAEAVRQQGLADRDPAKLKGRQATALMDARSRALARQSRTPGGATPEGQV
jgi:hypothetical protein